MTPDATPSPDRIVPGKPLESQTPVRSQPGSEFQSYMQGTPPKNEGNAPIQTPTPIELANPSMQTGAPTHDTLLNQARTVQDSLGTVQEQLNTPNLKLKRSQAHLLRNKLGDANNFIQAAASKMGLEPPPMKSPHGGAMERFMSYVNHGQNTINEVQRHLQSIASSGQPMSAGDMMLAQVKLSQAQQEIEYSSTILGKLVDAMKQLFNIQL
jgi:hypothetical protein